MKCPVKGIIHVTGEIDSGKSTFAYTAGPEPSRIAFFDNDLKSESIDKDLHFGAYFNLVRMFTQGGNFKPIAFFEMIMKLLDGIKEGEFDLIVFDNWTQIEGGINAYAEAHILEISDLSMGQAKSMSQLTWPAKRAMYGRVLDAFLNKAETVIVTTHLKDKWIGNVRTEAQIPQCQQPLAEKASLRLWLRHNPDSQAPIGLVLKRISKSYYDKEFGKMVIQPVLPRKIKPCTWEVINEYLENPLGDRALRVDEVPDEFELGILDGILTADQKMMFRAGLAASREDNTTPIDVPVEVIIKEMAAGGMKVGVIAKELGLGIAEVRSLM